MNSSRILFVCAGELPEGSGAGAYSRPHCHPSDHCHRRAPSSLAKGAVTSRVVEPALSFIKIFPSSYLTAEPRIFFLFSPSFPTPYLVIIQ